MASGGPAIPSAVASLYAAQSSSTSNSHANGEGSMSAQAQSTASDTYGTKKKKKHRAGRKRRNRRQSFAAPSDHGDVPDSGAQGPMGLLDVPEHRSTKSQLYRLNNHSDSSLNSEALLDHRDQPTTRPRRQSLSQTVQGMRATHSHMNHPRQSYNGQGSSGPSYFRSHGSDDDDDDDDDDDQRNDRTPLMRENRRSSISKGGAGYGSVYSSTPSRPQQPIRRRSASSSQSNKRRKSTLPRQMSSISVLDDYDVNNPPSLPGSPRLGGDQDFDEVMLAEFTGSAETSRSIGTRDAVINIDRDAQNVFNGSPRSPMPDQYGRRRQTIQTPVEDVCVPFDQMTEIGEEDFLHHEDERGPRRSRKRPWPDLSALEDWSREEKEERTMEGVRAKKVNEPELVGGRLRPSRVSWQKEDEDAPFRFTYFNEELDSSLRSYSISGLQQLGLSFRELFIPDPPELDYSSDDDDEDVLSATDRVPTPINNQPRTGTRQSSILDHIVRPNGSSGDHSGRDTPTKDRSADGRQKRYGPRPVFWLDVLQPTYDEMRVISRAFGIHKLTAEDIMEQEAREKVELFRNYYFVNYRTFEQDPNSEEFMDPVNMYFVVFKGGVISFHFSQMPHPPNVRRRIRQLAEHQYTDSDWISYAIIDNVTDAYAPLIEQIEKEVDDIDDEILQLHSRQADAEESRQQQQKAPSKSSRMLRALKQGKPSQVYEKLADSDDGTEYSPTGNNTGDMLLRVGECRKKVMGLYRLLGNKADVIKGLAKRCNEQWQVAPRSDVGLYLGDIQDHIITMTGNLTHYENILSRAHSNYLAQINIKMTERAEQTNDVLGKLTVLGTIVLPMNIITGMWGMNVTVPGQDNGNMLWFWGITAGLVVFGITCFYLARRLYRVV